MKEHFSKLLTEKERAGHRNLSAKWAKRLKYDPCSDYEKEFNRAPMSRHGWPNHRRGLDNKSLSDVLGPLKGYLRKSVGRKWDDVYSELAANLDKRSVSGLHVYTHLWQYVEKNCWEENGIVYYMNPYSGPSEPYDFYVHPKTGILCRAPVEESWRSIRKRREAAEPVTKIDFGEGKSAQFLDGIWYYIAYNLVTHKVVKIDKQGQTYDHYYQTWEFDQKLQLNKKELKQLKIKNLPR